LTKTLESTGVCVLKGTGIPDVKTLAFGISRVLVLVILKAQALTTSKAELQLKISAPSEMLAKESYR